MRIVTTNPSESFDSFLLQARGAERDDGNASLVGTFMSPLPSISKSLSCLDQPGSSVTDKGRPVQLRNLTFTWLSPSSDHGQIRFTLSLVRSKSQSQPNRTSLIPLQTESTSSSRLVRSGSTHSRSPSEGVAVRSPVSVSVITRPDLPAQQTSLTTSLSPP